MNNLNKQIYYVYRDLVDVIFEHKRLKNENKKDFGLVIVARNLLKKLYGLSWNTVMMNVWMRIDEVKELLDREINEESINIILNCLTDCKELLEINLSERRSILIYSEYPEALEELIRSFLWEGFNVIIQEDNKSFTEIVGAEAPDIIIIDNNSDTNNGITIFKLVLDDESIKRIPIILIGDPAGDTRLTALLLGAVDYIYKPFDTVELFTKIKNIIGIIKRCSEDECFEGIYSKKVGEEKGRLEFERAKSEDKMPGVLLMDLNEIGEISTRIGRGIGNNILRDFGKILMKHIDVEDFIYKGAPDKYAVVFINRNANEILGIAKKIQKDMFDLWEKYETKISFTGGIAVSEGKDDFNEILCMAVDCLSKAKYNGKGTIYVYSVSQEEKQRPGLLIVDNDRILLGILKERYANKGYEVIAEYEALNVFETVRNNRIDVIIMEYLLPGVSGDELIERIKKIKNNIKIIVLSSQKTEEFISSAFKSGADDYVLKPFSPVDLDLRVERLIK